MPAWYRRRLRVLTSAAHRLDDLLGKRHGKRSRKPAAANHEVAAQSRTCASEQKAVEPKRKFCGPGDHEHDG